VSPVAISDYFSAAGALQMHGVTGLHSRVAVSAIVLLALAGCGSSGKTAVESTPKAPTATTVVKTVTTAKRKPTLPATTVAPTTVPRTRCSALAGC
jgi:hypothetical protein